MDVKPGARAQFEAGLQRWLQWLHAEEGALSWEVWEITSGVHSGRFVLRSSAHDWQAMDADAELNLRAREQADKILGPHISASQSVLYLPRDSISREQDAPAELLTVNVLDVKYDRFQQLMQEIPALAEAMRASDYMFFRWRQLLDGGELYRLRFEFPKARWTDNTPPPVRYWDMVTAQLGSDEAERIKQIWFSSIESHTTHTERRRHEFDTPTAVTPQS